MKWFWKLLLGATALAAVGIQFAGPPRPPVLPADPENDYHAHVTVPANIDSLMNRACVNCHSNQTHYPWYARVAPVSWLANHDVARGREVFNVSEWRTRYGKKPAIAATLLVSACSSMQTGRMPKPQYKIMHPEAELSPAELETFCGWAKQESRSLMKRRRQALAESAAGQ